MTKTQTTKTTGALTTGEHFKVGRRTALVVENTGTIVRYSLCRANGKPFAPVYAMRNMDHEIEVVS